MGTPNRGRLLTLSWALLAVCLAALHAPAAVGADHQLVTTDPADGAEVVELPTELTLHVQHMRLRRATVKVHGPDGSRVDTGEVVVEQTQVVVPLQAFELPGVYTIDYRLVTSNKERVSGSTMFTVLDAEVTPAAGADRQQLQTDPSEAVKASFSTGLMVGVVLLLATTIGASWWLRQRSRS